LPASGLNYWEYLMEKLNVVFVDKQVTLDPGQEKVMFEEAGKGFWAAGAIVSNSPKAAIRWNLDGTELYDSIESIYAFGFVFPNNFYFYITQYDTDNDVYTMAWAPSYPGVFRNFARVSVVNTGTTTAVVRFFGYFAKVEGTD